MLVWIRSASPTTINFRHFLYVWFNGLNNLLDITAMNLDANRETTDDYGFINRFCRTSS